MQAVVAGCMQTHMQAVVAGARWKNSEWITILCPWTCRPIKANEGNTGLYGNKSVLHFLPDFVYKHDFHVTSFFFIRTLKWLFAIKGPNPEFSVILTNNMGRFIKGVTQRDFHFGSHVGLNIHDICCIMHYDFIEPCRRSRSLWFWWLPLITYSSEQIWS